MLARGCLQISYIECYNDKVGEKKRMSQKSFDVFQLKYDKDICEQPPRAIMLTNVTGCQMTELSADGNVQYGNLHGSNLFST